jgi:hypothetical protein
MLPVTRWLLRVTAVIALLSTGVVLLTRILDSNGVFEWTMVIEDIENGQSVFRLYDPNTLLHAPILSGIDAINPKPSIDGNIAFSVLDDDRQSLDLFVWNWLSAESLPVSINRSTQSAEFYPVYTWTPDGRYLIFTTSSNDDGALIKYWDGSQIIDFTPTNVPQPDLIEIKSFNWLSRSRFVFELAWFDPQDYSRNKQIGNREFYVWDGNAASSISQIPGGINFSAVAAADGRLAFLTRTLENVVEVRVWNPETSSTETIHRLSQIPGEGVNDIGVLTWLTDGQLLISTYEKLIPQNQNFQWDGGRITAVPEPYAASVMASWSPDASKVVVVNRSSASFLQLRVQDITASDLLTLNNVIRWQWTAQNHLLYCLEHQITPNQIVRTVFVWDGHASVGTDIGPAKFLWVSGGRSLVYPDLTCQPFPG